MYIDPDPTSSYAYVSLYGSPFASVVVPPGQGDDAFDLLGDTVQAGLTSGVPFAFPNLTDRFVITGIDNMADGFITGLAFASDGPVLMAQVPIDASGSAIPEPGTLALVGAGLLGLGVAARKKTT